MGSRLAQGWPRVGLRVGPRLNRVAWIAYVPSFTLAPVSTGRANAMIELARMDNSLHNAFVVVACLSWLPALSWIPEDPLYQNNCLIDLSSLELSYRYV